ncbi:hypothetical protein [Rhodococcus sp. (in: high G+C Gram-positive bacteria)]|uniref:nuclear transport factor 2 family protein n=1 Tax=Rhodococcus sp. TaxID=1831 RepID=UPI002579E775|nr:hypothetical protein [Rhodococcus sp. (in: high G+C Gram-positive bacteria)]MBQ9052095.1 hypothetical protein [Rhodococcus sp. (in: high G+C Gram-positive bacteria)]
MSLEENKSIVAKFYSKLCTIDAQEAFDLMAEDADWTMIAKSSIAPLGAVTKQTFIKEMLSTGGSLHPDRNPASIFPDGLDLTIKSLTAEGDHVVLEAESYAIAANGNIYNNMNRAGFLAAPMLATSPAGESIVESNRWPRTRRE